MTYPRIIGGSDWATFADFAERDEDTDFPADPVPLDPRHLLLQCEEPG